MHLPMLPGNGRRRLPGNKGNSQLSLNTIIKVGVNESYQWAQSGLNGVLTSNVHSDEREERKQAES